MAGVANIAITNVPTNASIAYAFVNSAGTELKTDYKATDGETLSAAAIPVAAAGEYFVKVCSFPKDRRRHTRFDRRPR